MRAKVGPTSGGMLMRPLKILLLVVATAVAVLAIWVLPLIIGFLVFAGSAKTTIYESAVSPDGRREARVQFSDCGAACSFEREVVVRRRNGFASSCTALLVHGEWPVSVKWMDAGTLLVSNPAPREELLSKRSRCGPVAIRVVSAPTALATPSSD